VKKANQVVTTLLESKTVRPFEDIPDLEIVYDGTAQQYANEQAVWNQFNEYVWRKIGVDPMDANGAQMRQAVTEIQALMQRWKAAKN
jgi:hypothetical protein